MSVLYYDIVSVTCVMAMGEFPAHFHTFVLKPVHQNGLLVVQSKIDHVMTI